MTKFQLPYLFIFFIAMACSFTAQAQDASNYEKLVAKAESEGLIRVIVRLNQDYSPEALLDEKLFEQQTQAIQESQRSFDNNTDQIAGIVFSESIENLPLKVLELNAEALEALRTSGQVALVVEDELAAPTLEQSVPLIKADVAAAGGASGAGQVVAILDTGVDNSHGAFAGKIVSQACYSSTSQANSSVSMCPDGQNQMVGGNAGRDCSTSVRGCGHGTHVAGIAAGNGASVVGVAKDAQIIAIQVFSRFNSNEICAPAAPPCALSYTSDQIKGLQRVQALSGQFSIASVNMSLGGGKSTSACDGDTRKPIIDALRSLGIATVIASGNDGFSDGVGAPGCISSAITTGSTTKSDQLSGFSNSAPMVDLLAPGSAITSARSGGGTVSFNGTSMATPHVTGAFAAAKSKSPTDSVNAIEAKLKQTGVSVTGKGITKPRINLEYLGDSVESKVGRMGYAWGNNPTSQSYTPSGIYSFNESGGAISIQRSGVGAYAVTFRGLGGNGQSGGHVQVTGYGPDQNNCKVRWWSSGGSDFVATVNCTQPNGAAVDARFTVLVYSPS